ncbi:MAG: DNA-3-methyladenine glycosylase I [Xanthomonadales bacterium]|nr:DNA-3-methyladenine glycosylase I [Xanthomonadales bacterium]NNL94693.1 DNA-3-methyladenine glycosylase I [Xanthomonadales bacterium]
MAEAAKQRCHWAGDDPLNVAYHDREWGMPEISENRLFEMLTLEGAQAGLSWITILRKREGYRQAFAEFDPGRVAGFGQDMVEKLVNEPAIVRHRGKIESTINNARRILALWDQGNSLSKVSWEAVGRQPRINRWKSLSEIPASTRQSTALSKRLKQFGFRFVGPTTCYAFMQAAGMVNDHETSCFRHAECRTLAIDFQWH